MSGKHELTLTPRDVERFAAVRGSWAATGLSTDAVSEKRAWPLVRALYAAHGLPPPALKIRVSSPVGAVCAGLICRQLQGQEWQPLMHKFAQNLWSKLDRQVKHQLSRHPDPWAGSRFLETVWAGLLDRVGGPLGELVLERLGSELGGMLLLHRFDDQLDSRLRVQLTGELGTKLGRQLTGQLWGQLASELPIWRKRSLGPWVDAHWLAAYDLSLPLSGLPRSPKRDALEAVLRETGCFLPMRGAAVVSDRPCRLELDAQLRLHSADGMALAWRDGCGFHYWHGRPVPAWVITGPSVAAISAEPNAEIRRCGIESLGWEVFMAQTSAALIGKAADPGNPGQNLSLYEVPERLWGGRINLLVAVNGTTERNGTRRRYGLTIPAEIRDPVAAAAWTYRLTKDQYAACQRRS